MTIRKNKYPIEPLITPKHVLLSVFDKTGLETLINGLLEINEDVRLYSTGGTGREVLEILCVRNGCSKKWLEERKKKDPESYLQDIAVFGNEKDNYMSVEEFTGAPEMEGGLVKTLHPKIHAGLLAERGNPAHEHYLNVEMKRITGSEGVYFDVMVGNLYPFENKIEEPDVTPETARVNIDIGGPTMIMASAKNWPSVAVLSSIDQYRDFIDSVKKEGGITLKQRFSLAQEAMPSIGKYRTTNGQYFGSLDFEKDVVPNMNIK